MHDSIPKGVMSNLKVNFSKNSKSTLCIFNTPWGIDIHSTDYKALSNGKYETRGLCQDISKIANPLYNKAQLILKRTPL